MFDIRRFTINDGPGIRTTVFFKGCPLKCWWCHNPESQEDAVESIKVQRLLDGQCFETKLAVGNWMSPDDVMKELEKDEVFYFDSGGGITFSGGEPLMQIDALKELLTKCKEKGYHTAVDTSGYAEPAAISGLTDLVDLWLYDIKLMDDSRHVEYTGVSNKLVLKNLGSLARTGKEIIIRFPLITGITDGMDNLEQISNLMSLKGLSRIDILPFHTIARSKYDRMHKDFLLAGIKEPGEEKVKEVEDYFTRKGFVVGRGG